MRETVDGLLEDYLLGNGEVFRVFELQDSGNISLGWSQSDGSRRFVKYTRDPGAFRYLQTAAAVASEIHDASLPALVRVLFAEDAMALVYDWVDGEVIGSPEFAGESGRLNPASPYYRFTRLPVGRRLAVLESLYRLHVKLEAGGWVSEDFYDGSVIYDFDRHRTHCCDLDHYHRGPYVLDRPRAFGSSRFLAPEELVEGRTIDLRTMVFTMGRTAFVFLSRGDWDGALWEADAGLLAVAAKAVREDPNDRYQTVRDYVAAWIRACREACREACRQACREAGSVAVPTSGPPSGEVSR